MIVPIFDWKLHMNLLLGCKIIPSFSAYCFIKSPISFLLTTVFLKVGGNLAKYAFNCSRTSRSHWTAFDFYFRAWAVLRWEVVEGGKLLEDDFLLSDQFGFVPTICTPTFQNFCILSVGYTLCAFGLVLFFYQSHNFVVSQWRASFLKWTVVEKTT